MTFNEKDGCHVKGDQVSYDLINGIVYNVTKIESQVTKKRKLKKPKKDKVAKLLKNQVSLCPKQVKSGQKNQKLNYRLKLFAQETNLNLLFRS